MAVIGNDSESFLRALSDFWIRFFADIGDLKATYEGTTVLFGQAYLDLLTNVLNVSVDDAPLFRREYYKLLRIRETDIVWRQDFANSTKSRWLWTGADVSFQGIGTLQNKVYQPETALILGTDVDIGTDGTLRFIAADPTNPTPSYFATNTIDVAVGGTFSATGVDWVATGVKKGDWLWAHPYATLVQGNRVLPDAQAYRIVHVTADRLSLAIDTPAPDFPSGFVQTPVSWWIDREGPNGSFDSTLPSTDPASEIGGLTRGTFGVKQNISVKEIFVWAVDAKVDDFTLYENFGHLLTHKEKSTEAYRALIKGLMQLYLLGPAIDRIESALNVIAYLPVIRNDGEVLTAYTSGVTGTWNGSSGTFAGGLFSPNVPTFTGLDVGGYVQVKAATDPRNVGIWQVQEVIDANTVRLESPAGMWAQSTGVKWEYSRTDKQVVTTTGGRYVFDRRAPMRADITGWNGTDVITFDAFEVLSEAVRVVDYVKDPTWWHNKPVPSTLLPGWAPSRRVASTQLLENFIGAQWEGCVGDPGFYVGANEDGVLYSQNPNMYRHRPAFIVMDRFLKAHIFQVQIDTAAIRLQPALITELSTILLQAKPAFTHAYLQPGTVFTESLIPTDSLSAQAIRPQGDYLGQQEHTLVVGGTGYGTWDIGDEWFYATTVMAGATITPAGSGDMQLLVGGLDPMIPQGAQGGYPPNGIYESPLYVWTVAVP